MLRHPEHENVEPRHNDVSLVAVSSIITCSWTLAEESLMEEAIHKHPPYTRHLAHCLPFFFRCCDKMPWKRPLSGKVFISAHSSRVTVSPPGRGAEAAAV